MRGWLGGSVERFFSMGRQSVTVGVGRFPAEAASPGLDDSWFTAFGAAYRRYLGSGSHQATLEASVTMVAYRRTLSFPDLVLGVDRGYGPGLAVGYRFTSGIGLHLDASAGGGWLIGEEEESLQPIGGLAIGYTWR